MLAKIAFGYHLQKGLTINLWCWVFTAGFSSMDAIQIAYTSCCFHWQLFDCIMKNITISSYNHYKKLLVKTTGKFSIIVLNS